MSALGHKQTSPHVRVMSPSLIGRSWSSAFRPLQLSAKYHVATPANWQPGDDTVVLPFISSDEEAERKFASQGGLRKVRSYLRFGRG